MKLWKKLTAAALMSAAMLGAGLTAMPVTGYEVLTYVTNNNDTVTVGDLKFSLYEDHAEVIWQNDKNASSVTIPAEVNGLPVTHIGSAVFRYMEELEHVTIPDSVTVIGYEAFTG